MAADDHLEDVTGLLAAAGAGDADAAERLFPVIYNELHRLAQGYMQRERPDHTLQPTALVNEAYLRLVGAGGPSDGFESRSHFIGAAAIAMRRILVNHAKARNAAKRGGGRAPLALDGAAAEFEDRAIDLLALDEALTELSERDETQARLVELRFFGGMSVEACALALGVSERTVQYEWAHARAWLRSRLEGSAG